MVLLQDLAIVEGWIYDGDYKGALLTKQQIIDRLEYAKLAGYIDRTIVLYAQMCPKGEEHPGGLTVEGVCSLISELQGLYPEMPGLNFYGCGECPLFNTRSLAMADAQMRPLNVRYSTAWMHSRAKIMRRSGLVTDDKNCGWQGWGRMAARRSRR